MTSSALAISALALGAADAQAQDTPARRPTARPHLRTAAVRPLTVHRRVIRTEAGTRIVGGEYYTYARPGLLRRWNDPNLYSFGGWRIGGENFYGDQRGDPITRGNSTLGQIAGYGPARGGYGGPHFDSVGGFHNGPGPDAKEDDDYASGSISTPDYGGLQPHYPSVKQRVAALNTGAVGRPTPSLVANRPPVQARTDAPPASEGGGSPFGLTDDGAF